jgi:hypothetical protein
VSRGAARVGHRAFRMRRCRDRNVVRPMIGCRGDESAVANKGINLTIRRYTAEEKRLHCRLCLTR